MPEVLQEQITGPGTTASDTPPWLSYASEMDEKLSPTLEKEIEEYSKHRHTKTSTQNEEELCRQREFNQGIAKEYQWLSPDEYKDEEPRIGRVLHSSTFIRTLRERCGVQCWYVQHPMPDKLTLLIGDQASNHEPQIGCWVQAGQMPEYSFMRFDDHGIPLSERRRGWRTCLLQLILKGALTEDTARYVFGEAFGPASERYNKTLYEFRNRGSGWESKEES